MEPQQFLESWICEHGTTHLAIHGVKTCDCDGGAAWPRWAGLLRKRRIASDTGVGDTAQRYAAKVGGEKFKRLSKWLGIPCGCTERQAEWNRLYPYD